MNRPENIDEMSLIRMLQPKVSSIDSRTLTAALPPSKTIKGLNTIADDLEIQEATIRARTAERRELDAKLAELADLIQQARQEVEKAVEKIEPDGQPLK